MKKREKKRRRISPLLKKFPTTETSQPGLAFTTERIEDDFISVTVYNNGLPESYTGTMPKL